jgi:hypothetical protein
MSTLLLDLILQLSPSMKACNTWYVYYVFHRGPSEPYSTSTFQVPRERLLIAFERAIVNIVNKVGVDIHRAMTDSYHQLLLPYVAGLGPRKAEVIMKRIAALVSFIRLAKPKRI